MNHRRPEKKAPRLQRCLSLVHQIPHPPLHQQGRTPTSSARHREPRPQPQQAPRHQATTHPQQGHQEQTWEASWGTILIDHDCPHRTGETQGADKGDTQHPTDGHNLWPARSHTLSPRPRTRRSASARPPAGWQPGTGRGRGCRSQQAGQRSTPLPDARFERAFPDGCVPTP